MGRATEFLDYINKEKHPTALEKKHFYTHINITEFEKEIRRNYRKKNKLKINDDINQ